MVDANARTLASMWKSGKFEPSIHHIRFPLYRNLAPGAAVHFMHPITALVGPNGTNKSSILRALQGCPENNNVGLYWFETALDTIRAEDRHRFIYGRLSPTTGRTVEVIKTRIARPQRTSTNGNVRRADPDYWEPSRPLVRPPDLMDRFPPPGVTVPLTDGSKTRWNPITMSTLYLDFRSELSAFDATFNHGTLSNPTLGLAQSLNARKDNIRLWAPRLDKAIKLKLSSSVVYNLERVISEARNLDQAELKAVCEILDRQYKSITVIRHRFFEKRDGWTAILRTGEQDYSEAFAGSGEFAVIMLVTKIRAAAKHTLVLMDEPEVSLHPAAQARLMDFINDEAKRALLQFVIATHSPEIIRNLPADAIKVLVRDNGPGSITIPNQSCPPTVAFDAIGADFRKPTVIVEDKLAKAIVEYAISDEQWSTSLEIAARPGGASKFWTYDVAAWALEDRVDALVLFDGDQKCPDPPNTEDISDSDVEKQLSQSFNNNIPRVFTNGGSGALHEQEKNLAYRKVLTWRQHYVRFLPFWTPEEFIYSHLPDAAPRDTSLKAKDQWVDYVASKLPGASQPTSDEILTLQKQALATLKKDEVEFDEIRKLLHDFLKGWSA